MRKIRRAVFETNSSSTHALTITPENRKHENYPNLDNCIRDGYLQVVFPGNRWEYEWENYDTFMGKLGYITALVILSEFGCYSDDKLLPGTVEKNETVKKWFSDVKEELGRHGIEIDGIDLSLNYVEYPENQWDYEYPEDDLPIITEETVPDETLSKFSLRCDLDHQVVESYVYGEKNWDTVLKKKEGEEATIYKANGRFSDIEVLFSPNVGIKYTWDSEPYSDSVEEVQI